MTTEESLKASQNKAVWVLVAVAALGYFVDVYDLIIFSVVLKASLAGLSVPESEMLHLDLHLLNLQVAGVLFGGAWLVQHAPSLARRAH